MKKLLLYLKDKLRRRWGILSPSRYALGLEKLEGGRVVDIPLEDQPNIEAAFRKGIEGIGTIHYWRTTTPRESIFGKYFIHSGWCGYKSFADRFLTAVPGNVTCGSCQNTTKHKEDLIKKETQ